MLATSFKAIFSDMDGTLLTSQFELSPSTARVVRAVRETGVAFILATGRPAKDVFETIAENNLVIDYVITNNGAAIYRASPASPLPASGGGAASGTQCFSPVRTHSLAPAVVKQLFALPVPREDTAAGHPLVAVNVFKGEDWFTTHRVGRLGLSYRPTFQPQVMPDLAAQDEAFFENVIQLFFYGPHEHLLGIKAALLARFPNWQQDMEFSFSLPHILDVTAPGIHKGVAVEEVCGLLGVDKSRTLSFGDGMNDLAMLKATGHACIMSNAMPELKAAMPSAEIIGDHNADGVAEKLSRVFDIPLS